MEQYRMPRRSQSHGTLRGNYTHHGRLLHKPLGRVNENSPLLSPTGALGGMLKTTTETGDIGLFSINSVPGTTLGMPSRGRNSLRSRYPPLPPLPLRRSAAEQGGCEKRKTPTRLTRDTASEIISMYGSNSQGSVTSTQATSLDDPVSRSYSMTTVGSRYLSHNRSNATLQSQASSGPLQRPRSPFPYPTRLKRPGARPVSPAVTEAGFVDYSRMVEIDRISLRTGHGPLKSSYPHAHRRPPPPGPRFDVDSFALSWHGHASPPPCKIPMPPYPQPLSAASVASWNREHAHNSTSRSSSLTSVVNMYYRMPPALKAAQFDSPMPTPRYYDYTEEFENSQSPSIQATESVASLPTKVPRIERQLVLRNGLDEYSATVLDRQKQTRFFDEDSQEEDSKAETEPHLLSDVDIGRETRLYSKENPKPELVSAEAPTEETNAPVISASTVPARKLTRESDIDLLPSQRSRTSVDTFQPTPDTASREVPLFSYPISRQSTSNPTGTPSPICQVHFQVMTPTIKSEQGVILTDDDKTVPITGCTCGSLGPDQCTASSTVRCYGRNSAKLLETAKSPEEDCKRHVSPQFSGTPASYSSTVSGRYDGLETPVRVENGSSPSHSDTSTAVRGRNGNKTFGIKTKHCRSCNESPQLTSSLSITPLIAPQPISPVRELKVTNSIPRLMKALPPLPCPPGRSGCNSPPPEAFGDDDFVDILKPCTSLDSLKDLEKSKPAPMKLSKQLPDIQKILPKIRIKSKVPSLGTKSSHRESRPWNCDSNYPWFDDSVQIKLPDLHTEEEARESFKQRLALRESFIVRNGAQAGTVRRNPEARCSEPITQRFLEHPKDLCSSSTGLSSAIPQVDPKCSSRVSDSIRHHSILYDAKPGSGFGGTTGNKSPVVTALGNFRVPIERIPDAGLIVKQHRGLRKRLSNLKWLLNRDSNSRTGDGKTEETELLVEKEPTSLDRTFEMDSADLRGKKSVSCKGVPSTGERRPRFRRRIKAKISKWIRGTS